MTILTTIIATMYKMLKIINIFNNFLLLNEY